MCRKLRVHSPSRAVSSPKDGWTDQMYNKSHREIWSEVCILHGLLWGLKHAAAHFVPTDGDWQPLSRPSRRPPPPRRPGVASRLKPCHRCHLVYIVTLEPVSSSLVFSLARLFFFFFLSAYLCLLLSILWCLQPKMKGGECFPVADLEGVKGQMFW